MESCERVEQMLSGYLDGELTQGDRQRVEVHIDACPSCQRVYDDLSELQDQVGQLKLDRMSPSEWSSIMSNVPIKGSRSIGWILLIAGSVIISVYGMWEFATDDTVPALVKTSLFAIYLGLAFLLISVGWQRLVERKTDKYKDIEI